MSRIVVDVSTVLTVLFAEKGSDAVAPRLAGALLSAVNLAEIAMRCVDAGTKLEDALYQIGRLSLDFIPLDAGQANAAASLRPATRSLGLSLGDLACLGLGLSRQLPVLTANREWRQLKIGVKVEVFR